MRRKTVCVIRWPRRKVWISPNLIPTCSGKNIISPLKTLKLLVGKIYLRNWISKLTTKMWKILSRIIRDFQLRQMMRPSPRFAHVIWGIRSNQSLMISRGYLTPRVRDPIASNLIILGLWPSHAMVSEQQTQCNFLFEGIFSLQTCKSHCSIFRAFLCWTEVVYEASRRFSSSKGSCARFRGSW